MLKIKNANGDELMRLEDNGDTKFTDKKFEEQYKEVGKKLNENKEEN